MIFMGDHIPAHKAYMEGQRISRDKEPTRNIMVTAAFKAAMYVHMEFCYRDFYNGGKTKALKCCGHRVWCESIWMNYQMTFAGYLRWPQPGEYLNPIQDGKPIMALDYQNFHELMASVKTFKNAR